MSHYFIIFFQFKIIKSEYIKQLIFLEGLHQNGKWKNWKY